MEDHETVPQEGRARDISIIEQITIYLSLLQKMEMARKLYRNKSVVDLREMLNYAKYKNSPVRKLPYDIVQGLSRDQLIEAYVSEDFPEEQKQQQIIPRYRNKPTLSKRFV